MSELIHNKLIFRPNFHTFTQPIQWQLPFMFYWGRGGGGGTFPGYYSPVLHRYFLADMGRDEAIQGSEIEWHINVKEP